MNVQVTQSSECVIRVTNLPETVSGEHKVKITSMLVSDMPASPDEIDHLNTIANIFGLQSGDINKKPQHTLPEALEALDQPPGHSSLRWHTRAALASPRQPSTNP